MRQLALGVSLRERASFDSFYTAAAPEAVQQLRRLAAGRAGIVWLHGPSGAGKSHLLQAVCHACAPELRVGLFPLREIVSTSEATQLSARLDGWQTLNVCCVDDVDVAVGLKPLELALFSLYRELDERRGVLIVSAQQPPTGFRWIVPDLGSRFAAAQVYRLRELDESEQANALRQRAQMRGLQLPDETLRYLQRRFPRDMRSLCALLDKLDTASLAEQRRITVPFIREVLGDAASTGC